MNRPWLSILLQLIGRITPPPIVTPPVPAPGPAGDLLDAVNVYRARHGRQPFARDACCEGKAVEHAKAVANGAAKPHGGFSLRAEQCQLVSAGENWAQASTAAESVQMWSQSPGHRANMLGDWKYGGAGIVDESAVLLCGDRQGLFPSGQVKP